VQRIVLILLGLVFAWAIGLFLFISDLPNAGGPLQEADGAVVYTGLGGARITTGMDVLASGRAKRLLISGVNPETTRDNLAEMWPGDSAEFDCCVDLGLEARTTEGNAREVRDWAREHGFKRLILVTSDYHMPRALLETRAQLPEATIIAQPVESGYLGADRRPATTDAWRQLAFEYTKFLAVRVKTLAPRREA
jgi:uncharacterized SAM-binding protein YcdF (DUF218 family)